MPKLDEAAIAEFMRIFKEKGGDIFLTLGIIPVETGGGRAVMKMPLTLNTSQLIGVFAGGALIALADIAATIACISGSADGAMPFTVQLSANLLRNTNTGMATAESRVVHSGRTMMVAETVVNDDNNRVLVRVTTVHQVAQVEKNEVLSAFSAATKK